MKFFHGLIQVSLILLVKRKLSVGLPLVDDNSNQLGL